MTGVQTCALPICLQRLATWGLGPIPSSEALAHEITARRRKLFSLVIYIFILLLFFFLRKTDVFPFRNGNDEGEQGQGGCGRGS